MSTDCRMAVNARPEAVTDIRHKVETLASAMPFTEQQIADITLSVGEAASNAVRHGSPEGEVNQVVLRCHRLEDRFVAEVSDEGYGFDPDALTCTDPCQLVEGGRGLYFMKLLMDRVTFDFDGGTTVRLTKFLGDGPTPDIRPACD